MKILRQIIIEFWFPLSASALWAAYSLWQKEAGKQITLVDVMNTFGPTFFLVSWVMGQFFRVSKQKRTEESLQKIESRFSGILDEFESKTTETIAHISGGNSYPNINLFSLDPNHDTGLISVANDGKYTLYDVTCRIVDINNFADAVNSLNLQEILERDVKISPGNLIPGHMQLIGQWKVAHPSAQDYNIFSSSRNGSFVQKIRLRKIDGEWRQATKIVSGRGEILFCRADEVFSSEELERLFS